MTRSFEGVVAYLSTQGNGAVHLPDGSTVYCADTLPAETVRLEEDAAGHWQLADILSPSPQRVPPSCTLFGDCGGCSVQHMQPEAIMAWKADLVRHALGKAGFTDIPVATTFQVAPHTRRRADLALRRVADGLHLGLHTRGSKIVTDMAACPVLHPDIGRVLPALRQVAESLQALRKEGSVIINLLDSGPDILLRTDAALTTTDRQKLARMAEQAGIARISWQSLKADTPTETAVQTAPVYQTIAGQRITPPPGAFLQATAESEQAIQQAVLDCLPGKLSRRSILVELFAGCGTLSFPLAKHCQVHTYESSAPAYAAMKAATNNTRITPFCRDLYRQPVLAKDIAKVDIVVLDPPHAGAREQMDQIVRGLPAWVIYVSCNPASLAKDAAALASAGYSLDRLHVIDQFLWSTETETVCAFKRESSRRSRNGLSRSGS